MATKIFKVGDKESWNSTQCEVPGTVRKKLNVLTEISTRHAAASPQNPQLLVESFSSGQADAQTPTPLKLTKTTKSTTKEKNERR